MILCRYYTDKDALNKHVRWNCYLGCHVLLQDSARMSNELTDEAANPQDSSCRIQNTCLQIIQSQDNSKLVLSLRPAQVHRTFGARPHTAAH